MFLGQKDHAHAVLSEGRQIDALLGHFFAVQRIGQLDQDTGAVTHERVGPHGTPVVQVFQDLECLGHDGVTLLALDVRHKADTTSIVLVGRVVQTGLLEEFFVSSRGHGALLGFLRRGTSLMHCSIHANTINWGQIPINGCGNRT